MLTPEQHDAEAARIRGLADAVQPMPVDDRGWLQREETIQKAVLLCTSAPADGERASDPELMHRYRTDAEFHAWICFEAGVRAEIELARHLGTQVQNGEVAAFIRARGQLLYSEGKRARYAIDPEYAQAVFTLAVHRMNEDPEVRATRERMAIDYLAVGPEAAAALSDVAAADIDTVLREMH